jgi:asparagine synthase (glutamine-hydrolysing)
MCGIAGFSDAHLSEDQKKSTIFKMLLSIEHRGKDCSLHFMHEATVLGHNRLSIIDTSDDANQPFHYKHLTIVFNGEIYNYLEVRDELKAAGHQFKTGSDTEVILHAYEEWGANCVEKFMGMWAFVIYNSESRELFCSRDRFGIKPFYYIFENNRFYFASEIKALKETDVFRKDINLEQVDRFLTLGLVEYRDQRWYRNIKALEASRNLTLKDGKLQITQYWRIKSGSSDLNFQDAVSEVRRLLQRSVQQHLRSDVKVGACLSGGIDSATLVSMMSQTENFDFDAYNVYYDGKGDTDERKWVYDVIEKYPNVRPHYICPGDDDIRDAFEKMVHIQDGPYPGSGVISQYFVFKAAAADQIKVMIDGQGADEYFGGYTNFYPYFFSYLMRSGKLLKLVNEIDIFSSNNELNTAQKLKMYFRAFRKMFMPYEQLKKVELQSTNKFMKENIDHSFEFIDNSYVSWYDTVFLQQIRLLVLPNLLHFEDRNSMAFTIESRVPYLDHRLVEFVFSLPFDYKMNNGLTKYILRESARGLTPDSILSRTDKRGFTTPGETKWLRGQLSHLLEKENLKHLKDICYMPKVYKLAKHFKDGKLSESAMLWKLVTLNEWMKTQ